MRTVITWLPGTPSDPAAALRRSSDRHDIDCCATGPLRSSFLGFRSKSSSYSADAPDPMTSYNERQDQPKASVRGSTP